MVATKRSICLFCSLGCGAAFRTAGEHVTAIDYDKADPVGRGSLCPRGHYNFEMLNHPERLIEPQLGDRKLGWREALSFLKRSLKEFDHSSVGIVLSGLASNEEAYLAAKLAGELGTKNIAAAGDMADLDAYRGAGSGAVSAGLAKIDEIGGSAALLIIGDILTRSPVLAKWVNQVKYAKKGGRIIVVDPVVSHTAWFATDHLQVKPGTEAALMAAILTIIAGANGKHMLKVDLEKAAAATGLPAETIIEAAQGFNAAASGTIIFAPEKSRPGNDLIAAFAKTAAGLSPNKKYINFYSFGNALGVNTILDRVVPNRSSYHDLLNRISSGQIKAMLMLGEDLAAAHPELARKIRHLKFTVMSGCFTPEQTDDSVLLLPLASHLESAGSYTLADGRTEKVSPVAPRVGARSNLEIISSIIGSQFDPAKVSREAAEVIAQGRPETKLDLPAKMEEAQGLKASKKVPRSEITHFGSNALVRRFFWYKVNKVG